MKKWAYYNENDPYAAQWLRNLIVAGHIAPGEVDERPIQEVEAFEVAGFAQAHWFAGIGIWSAALRRAGWPDDRPIWTGSCPCQPFSAAGKQKGFQDDRHLWPYWFALIEQRKPPIVVGEQVASKDGLRWFDLVSTDMEGADYAIGASDLCAAGFREAHLRQRLYFVGLADSAPKFDNRAGDAGARRWAEYPNGCATIGLADDDDARLQGWLGMSECADQRAPGSGGMAERMADSVPAGRTERRPGAGSGSIAGSSRYGSRPVRHPGQTHVDERWFDCDWLLCRNPAGEPSFRPVESGTFPLAHGIAGRMGKLRAYGNALDFETAKNFCGAVMDCLS